MAVIPRRPRKTFKLRRFRPTDGFARQVHDPAIQLLLWMRLGPGRRGPQFRAVAMWVLLGDRSDSYTTCAERPQIATGAFLGLIEC